MMITETVETSVTVIGGGLAGVCAAIAAARLGCTVALVQNRPVLGGNSSSEVRVWVCGAKGRNVHRYARETGIMGELFLENQYVNPDGNPYLWDLVLLEAVRAESGIRLFLNTDVHEVEAYDAENGRRIRAATGWMMGSERRIRFQSEMFIDCSGDGLIGFLAGAKFRLGREARHEFNEPWAPVEADGITLGSTILFYTKDAGHPVRFVPPSFAKDIAHTPIPVKRVIRSGDSGCHYWWIEWGGELDAVHDNERIRDELWAVVYGIWDFIKNSGKFQADTLTLEWVGAVPGKREYRRFVGDYVLTQNDILAQTPFADRVAFGGWSIDLHPPQGMYAEESGSKHMHADGNYHIPFRCLYSVNVDNLMFAGRNISASHIAFGTTRVMATCAVLGEAAGTGAALCTRKHATPRNIYREHMEELQRLLIRQDASIIGISGEDRDDLAKRAAVAASSVYRKFSLEDADEAMELVSDVGWIVPVDPEIGKIELLLDADRETTLELQIWSTGRKENYIPCFMQRSCAVTVEAGERQWVEFAANWRPMEPQNAFIVVKSNAHIRLHMRRKPLTGVLAFRKDSRPLTSRHLEDHQVGQPVLLWSMRGLDRKAFCFRMSPETEAFSARGIIDGYVRPYGGPHQWMSRKLNGAREEWVSLGWERTVDIREIHITFNDDVNEYLINLHFHRTAFDVIPELARDYRIEILREGEWHSMLRISENRKRKRIHRLPRAVRADAMRVVVESTNGGEHAEIVEVRVYGEPPEGR